MREAERQRATHTPSDGIPSGFSDLTPSEFGLDWADIHLIRERLRLTPTERLQAAQETLNAAIRIRAHSERSG
jgi:hypothetical protein